MNPIPVIQFVATVNSPKEALEQLRSFALIQVDSLGGRVIGDGYINPWAMQAFFSVDGIDEAAILPDGCRRVQAPASMLTCPIDAAPQN
jgi:hypothetical protein